jgi:hypothetical protein
MLAMTGSADPGPLHLPSGATKVPEMYGQWVGLSRKRVPQQDRMWMCEIRTSCWRRHARFAPSVALCRVSARPTRCCRRTRASSDAARRSRVGDVAGVVAVSQAGVVAVSQVGSSSLLTACADPFDTAAAVGELRAAPHLGRERTSCATNDTRSHGLVLSKAETHLLGISKGTPVECRNSRQIQNAAFCPPRGARPHCLCAPVGTASLTALSGPSDYDIDALTVRSHRAARDRCG